MTIKPLADRVLVKIEVMQEKTASGLFIPQTAQEKTQIAEVVALGDDTEAITVKVGTTSDGLMRAARFTCQNKVPNEISATNSKATKNILIPNGALTTKSSVIC